MKAPPILLPNHGSDSISPFWPSLRAALPLLLRKEWRSPHTLFLPTLRTTTIPCSDTTRSWEPEPALYPRQGQHLVPNPSPRPSDHPTTMLEDKDRRASTLTIPPHQPEKGKICMHRPQSSTVLVIHFLRGFHRPNAHSRIAFLKTCQAHISAPTDNPGLGSVRWLVGVNPGPLT